MTANHAHTPSDEEMRDEFINLQGTFANGSWEGGSLDRWNRWITERDARIKAAAEQRGASIVLRDLASSLIAGHEPDADTRIFDPWDVAEMLRYRANKADEERTRLEGDND